MCRGLAHEHIGVKKLMNHSRLKKEITEAFSSLKQVDRLLSKRSDYVPVPVNSHFIFPALLFFAPRLVLFDICAGKGILSFLLAFMLPAVRVVMMDCNKKIQLDHLNIDQCKAVVQFEVIDIYSSLFPSLIRSRSLHFAQAEGRDVSVMLGIHLCGTLSTRIVEVFNQSTAWERSAAGYQLVTALAVSPCCMPRRSTAKAGAARERLRANHWDPYEVWCLSVYALVDAEAATRNIVRDEHVLSEKSTFIIALKKEAAAPTRQYHDDGNDDADNSTSGDDHADRNGDVPEG